MQASEQCNAWVILLCYSTKACAVVLVIGLNRIAGHVYLHSRGITSLLQSVASRADAFVRQHIPSQTPLSLLVLFPAAHDHCSIDFQAFNKPFGKRCFTQRFLAIFIPEKWAGFLPRFYIKPIMVAFAHSP
jgi:hypothetical protein